VIITTSPNTLMSSPLAGPNGDRLRDTDHPVQDRGTDGKLGVLGRQCPSSQLRPDQMFAAADGFSTRLRRLYRVAQAGAIAKQPAARCTNAFANPMRVARRVRVAAYRRAVGRGGPVPLPFG
jgi:hypothetical protein